ncbi:MAG TPA: hypothetical protein VF024_04190 [Solirubrobacteraceae bacterium]
MELLLTAILLGAVVIVIAGPLRPGRHAQTGAPSARRAIEIAKDAKYREILDAELDFQTGKLSEPDYREVDRQLRVEASELLALEAAQPEERAR